MKNNPINFSIDSTAIKEITFGDKTTYTMSVVRDIQQTESFENFIVQVDNTTNNIRAFLIEYFPETEIEHEHEHNSFSFHGTKTIREIEYDSTIFQPLVQSSECTATLMCDYGGDEHVAGGNCTQTYLVIDCNTGGGGGSGGSGSGSGDTGSDGSGYGNGGGGGGSSGSGSGTDNTNPLGDPLVTAPVITEEYLDEQAQIKREKDFKRNLNWDQSTWFNTNTDAQNSIYEYLESQISNSIDETYPQEAKEFTMELIDYLLNNPAMTWDIVMNNRTSFDTNEGEIDNYIDGGFDTTTYSVFNPQTQSWPQILSVIPQNKFIGWKRNLHPSWHCMDYSKEQLRVMGYQISSYYSTGQTFQIYTNQNGVNNTALSQGLSYLKYALSNSIPVIVGVDDAPGHTGNLDNTTDHFIVIVGMGTDSNGKYFQFYDNATGVLNNGTSLLNKLYYNSTTGLISGTSQAVPYSTGLTYTITMIRKSKPL